MLILTQKLILILSWKKKTKKQEYLVGKKKLKVGEKNLFHMDFNGKCSEIYPMCVLDFYVHESM